MTEQFNKFDKEKKGNLTWSEAKEFFSVLFKLNLKRKKDYEAFIQLIKEMGCEPQKPIEKQIVINFFMFEDGYSSLRSFDSMNALW